MSNLDTLYRAFVDFRKTTSDDHDCMMQRNTVARTDSNKDLVETVRYTCQIDEDWVEAIEQGMVFVEKAIAEERQFIRNNGEVVPIEKVKRVSRDSVEHLAKHSGLITKEPAAGKSVIPDQLYTVERLSDYAVYENRFLYMLLKYLEQFISLRYNKIVELANTYRGKLNIDKSLKTRGQSITFKVELAEERSNDPLLSELNPNKSIIERIAMLLKMVLHYLKTPLMLEVSKSPMLHPPITVTNVLRMNHNFNGAMRLYEFVSSYDKPGYSAEKQVKKISPFPDISADEFAEIEALSSYLTYQYGMGVKEILRDTYIKEEERRKKEAEQKKLEKLAALRKRIQESGESPEEYMLLLESRNRTLELDSAQLVAARNEIERLNAEISKRDTHISELNSTVDERDAEIARLNAKYEQDMQAIKASHDEEMRIAEERHEQKLAEQAAQYAEETEKIRTELNSVIDAKDAVICQKDEDIRRINNDCKAEIDRINNDCKIEIARVNNDCKVEIERMQEECDKRVSDIQRLIDEKEKQRQDVIDENKLLTELKILSDARLNAVKYKHGYMTPADDYTSELAFNEIELQYNIFKNFFKKVWRQTKKRIRKELAEKMNADAEQSEAKQTVDENPQQQSQPDKQDAPPIEETAEQESQPDKQDASPIEESQEQVSRPDDQDAPPIEETAEQESRPDDQDAPPIEETAEQESRSADINDLAETETDGELSLSETDKDE